MTTADEIVAAAAEAMVRRHAANWDGVDVGLSSLDDEALECAIEEARAALLAALEKMEEPSEATLRAAAVPIGRSGDEGTQAIARMTIRAFCRALSSELSNSSPEGKR